MQGPQTGMGPVWLQGGRFKKCDQLHTEPCDITATDQCCAVIPCSLCLRWEVYGEPDVGGIAAYDRDFNKWRGGFGTTQFEAYWQRNYQTNECEFIVELNGVVVAVRTCADLSCRNPGGNQSLTINYDHGILYWEVYERRTLPRSVGYDGCPTFFCGTCECTCKTLCVTIRAAIYGSTFTLDGQAFVRGTAECDAPVWSGSVDVALGGLRESIYVEFIMYRDDQTGDCLLGGSARGEHLIPQRMQACDVGATFELSDGTVIIAKCFACTCASTNCEFCCLPMDFSNPLYPAGVYKPIPFSFRCGAKSIDGSFATSPSNLPCTEQVTYYGPTFTTPSQTMYVEGIDAQGHCATTPCTNLFGLLLECTNRFAVPGEDSGCDRLFLWVGSTRPLVGDDGSRPTGSLPDINSWVRVRPTACTCDEVGGVSGIFSFAITVDCSGLALGSPYGPCYDKILSCCDFTCSGTLAL